MFHFHYWWMDWCWCFHYVITPLRRHAAWYFVDFDAFRLFRFINIFSLRCLLVEPIAAIDWFLSRSFYWCSFWHHRHTLRWYEYWICCYRAAWSMIGAFIINFWCRCCRHVSSMLTPRHRSLPLSIDVAFSAKVITPLISWLIAWVNNICLLSFASLPFHNICCLLRFDATWDYRCHWCRCRHCADICLSPCHWSCRFAIICLRVFAISFTLPPDFRYLRADCHASYFIDYAAIVISLRHFIA